MNGVSATPDVVVIGAGPAGLAAGVTLGARAVVLEQSAGPGGLSCTIEMAGAVFDLGGHSFHTPHPEIRALVEGALELYEQTRDARCFSHGRMIRYPFQQHFRDLSDAGLVEACSAGLRDAPAKTSARHFLEFLEQRFGAGIARHFLVPYNRKLWGHDLSRLAADWAGERVAAPEGERETFDETGGRRKPLQTTTRVAYPARGGFGAIMTALAARLSNIRYGQRVVAIDPRRRILRTHDGHWFPWNRLISTLPLPQLVTMCQGMPPELIRAAGELECLSLDVVLLVVGHPIDTAIQRVYCADDTVPAHKVALNHNSSPYLRSLPRHGIMAEVSATNGARPADELIAWTIRGLCTMGILGRPDEVVAKRVIQIKHAYPVPTHTRDAIVGAIRGWLERHDIHTVGRFGEWAYINSDEAMHRGLCLGRRV